VIARVRATEVQPGDVIHLTTADGDIRALTVTRVTSLPNHTNGGGTIAHDSIAWDFADGHPLIVRASYWTRVAS